MFETQEERSFQTLSRKSTLSVARLNKGLGELPRGVTALDNRSSTSYQVRVPLLNPGEHVSIATMMTIPEGGADPEVAARAVGVTVY
jgi:hypothetical protein